MRKEEKKLHLCSDLIAIQVRTPEGREHHSVANLETISASHAGVQTQQPLPARSSVRLLCATCEFRGKVTGCRFYEGLGYVSEIRFNQGERWSRDRYEPKHLLDPAQVVASQRVCCEDESQCPRAEMAELLAPGMDANERVRRVAQAVAAICGDLDETAARKCFSRLFQIPTECRMGGEFAKSYALRRRELTGVEGTRTLAQGVSAVADAVCGTNRPKKRPSR